MSADAPPTKNPEPSPTTNPEAPPTTNPQISPTTNPEAPVTTNPESPATSVETWPATSTATSSDTTPATSSATAASAATSPARPDGCAVVTGGSRGIGAAIARALAADGWAVAVNYRSGEAEAAAVVASIEAAGGRAVSIGADVADPAAAGPLLEAAAEALGAPVLVLVNNAGIRADGLALSLTDDDWQRVLDTNLGSTYRLTRAALRAMIRARFGRVVNIASVVGPRANAGQANYAASKAAVIGFTKTVAVEVARRGVTVNAIAPGLIETDMTSGIPETMLERVPAQRAGTPEEVGAAVAFLASPAAAYITGTTLYVDGGLSA